MEQEYYLLVDVDIHNIDEYKKYLDKVKPMVEKFGGKYLARGGKFITKEGQEYQRNVIIEFPSFEKAKAAYESEEYKKALKVLGNGMDRTLVIVEGAE